MHFKNQNIVSCWNSLYKYFVMKITLIFATITPYHTQYVFNLFMVKYIIIGFDL